MITNEEKDEMIPELRKVQLSCFEILRKLKTVCDKHGLKYYLAYGTLLGAIRHKGYIPWDDDIDVWMPRPDMEKFLEICQEEMAPYVINYYTIKNNACFKYRSQPCIEDQNFRVGFDLGGTIKPGYIWIDIMPLDGMPDDKTAQKIQCKKFSIMYALIGLARSSRIGAFNKSQKNGIKKLGIKVNEITHIGRLLNVEKLLYRFDNLRKKYSFDSCDSVIGTTTSYTDKAIFLKEWFSGERYTEFEGESFSIPKDTEKILKCLYGNYMELPPIEKRVRSHFSKIYEE